MELLATAIREQPSKGEGMHARVSFYDASADGVDAGIEQFRSVTASVEQ
jgi:hypothetical protein